MEVTANNLELLTAVSSQECEARLSAAINIPPDGYDNLWSGSGSSFVAGEVQEGSFALFIARAPEISQSFGAANAVISASGTLNGIEAGTLISGRCGMNGALNNPKWLWIGSASFIGVPLFFHLLHVILTRESLEWSDFWDILLIGACLSFLWIVGCLFFSALFETMHSHEAEFLRGFLAKTLEAHEP